MIVGIPTEDVERYNLVAEKVLSAFDGRSGRRREKHARSARRETFQRSPKVGEEIRLKASSDRPIQKSGFFGWRSDRSRRRSASARRQGGLNRLVGGLSGLPGRTRGVSSDRGRGGSPDAAHRVGLSAGTPSLSRTAGSGRRPGPPAAGRRSAGWREADARSGPRGARWRWPRWSGRPDCAADCRRAPGSGPRRR